MPIDLLHFAASQAIAAPPVTNAGSVESRVLEFTRRIFGGTASIARELDPETNEECTVVTAVVAGTVEEIVAGNDQWHRTLTDHCGEAAGDYRLSLDPR